MFPVFRTGEGMIRIGPLMADMNRCSVTVSPWPEWMEEVIPDGIARAGYRLWSTVGFSPWLDGMVWVVGIPIWMEGKRAWERELLVLFLSGGGDLIRPVRVSGMDVKIASHLMVSGEYVLACGALIRDFQICGSIRPVIFKQYGGMDVLMDLETRRACLGPDGALIFPDGRALFPPDGSWKRVFHPHRIRRAILGELAGTSRRRFTVDVSRRKMRILGWEREVLWLMTEIFDPARKILIASIHLSGDERMSVRIAGVFDGSLPADAVQLHDGGWVVVFRNGRNEPQTERWVFHLPGQDGIFEHELHPDPVFGRLHGHVFLADRSGGLLSVLEAIQESRSQTMIMSLNTDGARTIPLLQMPYVNFLDVLMRGWTVAGAGKRRVVISAENRGSHALPSMMLAADDFLSVIRRHGADGNPRVNGIIVFEKWILVHGGWDERGNGFASSFRIRDGRPELSDLAVFRGVPGKILGIRKGVFLRAFFRIDGSHLRIMISMARDGSLMISYVI